MGVPKFYRWISERYPCLSEIVKEYQIPEFDNLYLDMNGIIHNCSHPNDDDPHFRISEEQIFKDIFHYIEVLFRMIQPCKVFFMAIDGVAPRAKMNQQRGRRFRSAREAEDNEKKAREKGEVLPAEARFDSNCITPGTEFMTKLDSQLQYFITSKISHDKLWQNCTVIYSGHKTPGEGEHKIMEYIRYAKSQPNYDSNTRHCLYGLDADLMMLGLTSHEPHFSLLREEVKFGGKKSSNKRTPTPEETTFHLLHLSLMREYIEYEFYDLHKSLTFPFDVEAVIDDWVFMGFLVGNDFIPNLPGLHINKDALPILYETYKAVLPSMDGYMNEGGTLNLKRFELFMQKLTEFDIEQFEEFSDNMKYIRCKKGAQNEVEERINNLEKFDFDDDLDDNAFGSLDDCPLSSEEVNAKLARLGIQQDPVFEESHEDDDNYSNDDEETQLAAEFRQHKRHYYMTKMEFEEVTADVLKDQASNYVRGLQWILNYYYNGICSWSWYYPFHYAPYISDIKDFAHFSISFEMGNPFLPFEQLLAVLPPLSVTLLPEAYSKLMLSEESPLKFCYPREFSTDLNGKQQDWEAVVLIPFIDEKLLLEAMAPCNAKLKLDEKNRNQHGPMFIYKYTSKNLGEYKAPQYFPPIGVNHADVDLVWRDEWNMHPSDIIKGLLPGVKMDTYFAGFPTLKHLDHTFRKGKESVKVFQQPSRSDNFILEITRKKSPDWNELINKVLGKTVFVSWPHLIEAKVIAISSNYERYYLDKDERATMREELDIKQAEFIQIQKESLKTAMHDRWGIDIKETELIIFAKPMSGRTYTASYDGKITLEKQWSVIDQPFPLQAVVRDIATHDPAYLQYKTIQEYFESGSKVFMLGHPHYGCMGEVIEIDPEHKGRIRVSMIAPPEPNFDGIRNHWQNSSERYMIGAVCATRLSITPHLFARITGTVFLAAAQELNPFIERENAKNKLNIGLNLKNNKKAEEVVGFTRKCPDSKQWLYSEECIKALREYLKLFPEIFVFLHQNISKNDIFQDEIFHKNYKERMQDLIKFLKEAPFANAERCKWGSVLLDPNIVAKISEEVDKVSEQRAKSVRMQIRPHLLYKPNPLQGSTPPDPNVSFELFDRIINVREGFSVPFGALGTIIGIQPAEKESDKLYDILFDKPFTDGLTLAGPASAFRCYRLHWAAMINLSHGKRMNEDNGKGPHVIRNFSYNRPNQNYQDHRQYNNSNFVNQPYQKNVNKPAWKKETPPVVRIVNNRTSYDVPIPSENVQPKNVSNPLVNVQPNFADSPEPPNPNQLPKPRNFQWDLLATQGTQGNVDYDKVKHARSGKYECLANHRKNGAREIRSENDVAVVIHGNFFVNWPTIKDNGLKREHRNYIPCVSYIPPKMGSRSYQIHIYLNVKKLLQDGVRLLLLPEGQVLCSTNSNGFVSPRYFEKVIDTESGYIIFPLNNAGSCSPYQPKVSANINQNMSFVGHLDHNKARGRGRGGIPHHMHPSQPIKLYENIWTQMQNSEMSDEYDKHNPGQRSAAYSLPSKWSPAPVEERKEVSVTELFQFASQENRPNPLAAFCLPMAQASNLYNDQNHLQRSVAPLKSTFVPTQVSRNQTTRKPYSDDASGPKNSPPKQSSQKNEPVVSLNHYHPNDSKPSNKNISKPKKKQRSRIAANFGAPPNSHNI